MSDTQRHTSRAHLLLLTLCVLGCVASALWPRPEPPVRPERDAAVLVRGVLGRLLGGEPEPGREP